MVTPTYLWLPSLGAACVEVVMVLGAACVEVVMVTPTYLWLPCPRCCLCRGSYGYPHLLVAALS